MIKTQLSNDRSFYKLIDVEENGMINTLLGTLTESKENNETVYILQRVNRKTPPITLYTNDFEVAVKRAIKKMKGKQITKNKGDK